MRLRIIVLSVIVGVGLSAVSCKNRASKTKSGDPVVLQVGENQGVYKDMYDIPEIEIFHVWRKFSKA